MTRSSPPREDTALLQRRAVCGRCSRHFRIRYAARRGRLEAWYICDRANGDRGEPSCQSIAGAPIDIAIGMLIGEEMTPAVVRMFDAEAACTVLPESGSRIQACAGYSLKGSDGLSLFGRLS